MCVCVARGRKRAVELTTAKCISFRFFISKYIDDISLPCLCHIEDFPQNISELKRMLTLEIQARLYGGFAGKLTKKKKKFRPKD